MNTDDVKFMALALEESRKGLNAGERPFGAVIVLGGEVIACTHSVVESSSDPTNHAEICAIRAASSHLRSPSLKGCTLYASCEPCPMCAGAVFASRMERVVVGASSQTLAQVARLPSRSYSIEGLSKQMNVKLEVVRSVF